MLLAVQGADYAAVESDRTLLELCAWGDRKVVGARLVVPDIRKLHETRSKADLERLLGEGLCAGQLQCCLSFASGAFTEYSNAQSTL